MSLLTKVFTKLETQLLYHEKAVRFIFHLIQTVASYEKMVHYNTILKKKLEKKGTHAKAGIRLSKSYFLKKAMFFDLNYNIIAF